MGFYAAIIAYDGSAFSGFAKQKDHTIKSVLGTLQESFARVGIFTPIIGAGRTDKGVHATRQVIRFECDYLQNTLESLQTFTKLLNTKLYPHICIRTLYPVDKNFHPRFDAKARAYRYLISPTLPSPFESAYLSYEKIGDEQLLQEMLNLFVGTHNFTMFKKNGSFTKDDIRSIYKVRFYPYQNLKVVYIEGSGFLRAQVRLMLGAALAVSRGELSCEDFIAQLQAHKQSYTYPISPYGLYLCKVIYKNLPIIPFTHVFH